MSIRRPHGPAVYNLLHFERAGWKTTGAFMRTEAAGKAGEEYARIRTEYRADAWLYRTVTTKSLQESENRRLVRRQRYLPVILWRRRKRRSTMFLWIRREKSAGHQAHSVRPDAHAIEVLTEQPRRAGDFPAQEDRMLGWRWNLAGMFGKRQTARRKKRGRISVRGCF